MAHAWLASYPDIIESKISDLFNFVSCLSVSNVVNYPTYIKRNKNHHIWMNVQSNNGKNEIYIGRKSSSGFGKISKG
jgi:hypothetical protein